MQYLKNKRVSSGLPMSKLGSMFNILLRLSDLLVACGAALAAWLLRFGKFSFPLNYSLGIAIILLLTLIIFNASGLYRSWRGEELPGEVIRVWLAWFLVFAVFLVLQWMFKATAQYSRLWVGLWFIFAAILFAISRWFVRFLLTNIRRQGIDLNTVVVIGATQIGMQLVSILRRDPWSGLKIIGYVATPYDHTELEGVPCLGGVECYLKSVKNDLPNQIWLALPLRAESLIEQCLDVFEDTSITLRLIPDLFGYQLLNNHVTELAGVPVLTLRGTPIEGHARLLKAVEDRFLAALILVMISPLMLLIAIGVKLSSSGPVIYRQKRHGLGGQEIYVLKFRTMRHNQAEDGSVQQATRDDHRVTLVGRFLRRSSLDELPQLVNVLRGEMSIVGPRPHAVEHNEFYSRKLRGYMQRHGVKPGMTGWAQVNGLRGETDTIEKMAKRVEQDIYYINNWSIWLDLKIILMTPLVILARTNAY